MILFFFTPQQIALLFDALDFSDSSYNRNTSPYEIKHLCTEMFRDKNVYLLPGRSGQFAQYARKQWGARVGMATDSRYIQSALNMLETDNFEGPPIRQLTDAKNISFLAQARVTEVPWLLAPYRPDIAELIDGLPMPNNYDGKIIVPVSPDPPNYVISSNMLTKPRYKDGNTNPHQMGITWQKTLARILAIGKPKTTLYVITPDIEGSPVCTPNDIKTFMNQIPGSETTFFSPKKYNQIKFLFPLPTDFTFLVRLNTPVPKELL